MAAQSERALALARWLETQPQVERVFYPGLASHPQHALAMAQQSGCGGAVVSFVVAAPARMPPRWRAQAFHVIDCTEICSITANLGDTKTTITHPGQHLARPPDEAQRQAAGITQGLIRVAVGLDDVEDIQADLARGLGVAVNHPLAAPACHRQGAHAHRAVADRLPAPRHCPHGPVLVGLRAPSRRRVRAAHRGHRRRTLDPGVGRPDPRGHGWLGLDYDEGPIYQMQRLERYREVAERMIAEGSAYRCYCSPAELEAVREAQRARGEKTHYDGRWRPEPGKTLPHGPRRASR